jgi:hypothetical protein
MSEEKKDPVVDQKTDAAAKTPEVVKTKESKENPAKKPGKAVTPTPAKEKKSEVERIFKEYNTSIVYTTSDGISFLTPSSAKNHAKTLKDNKIKEFRK